MVVFSLFSLLAILSSFMVIGSFNPVHSVFFLILAFCFSSCVLIILTVDFMSIILVVVYVGAIAVLFLFIVMMLNIKQAQIYETFIRYWVLTIFLGVVFFGSLFLFLERNFSSFIEFGEYEWISLLSGGDNVVLLGRLIYSDFIIVFLVSGLVLLVAMLGTIMLTLHHSYQVRRQQIYKQIGRDSANSLRFAYNIVQK